MRGWPQEEEVCAWSKGAARERIFVPFRGRRQLRLLLVPRPGKQDLRDPVHQRASGSLPEGQHAAMSASVRLPIMWRSAGLSSFG
jgi:hypothetical protein